ncbi:hypothetical protein [Streptomyces formicae]
MADSATAGKFHSEFLPELGHDLSKGRAAYFSVDLVHGTARMYATDDYLDVTPVLVGAGWHYRVPIPPVDNEQANALMRDLSTHAEILFNMVAIREEPLGVIHYGGSGTAIDVIQRKCAQSWRDHYALDR